MDAGDVSLGPLPRFVSVNIPNLHYIEDDFRFEAAERYRMPNEFEIRDALEAVRQMGGGVVRIYALSVRKPTDGPRVIRHVTGPGQFDSGAFEALDLVLALCREYGVKVIIPFVDNWRWWGGVAEYAAFRSKSPNAFWSDPELIADFERTVEYVVHRVNTLNGVRYADDPTILAWETGNELQSPWSWVETVAHYLKQQDPKHPVIDGYHSATIRPEALDSELIDVLSTHHYDGAAAMQRDIRANLEQIAGKKPYFVGEFGFMPANELAPVLTDAFAHGLQGALIWSLRFRNRDGGFYFHAEKPGFEAYHWPGFASGDGYEERAIMKLLAAEATRLAGVAAPGQAKPHPPIMLPSLPVAISWQGAAGAETYSVERAQSSSGPWQILAIGVSDAERGYRPLYNDTSIVPGQSYYYRVVAHNGSGDSEPSNVLGPVSSQTLRFVDELVDARFMSRHEGPLKFVSSSPSDTKMDRDRAAGAGSILEYHVAGEIREIRVDAFLRGDAATPRLESTEAKGQLKLTLSRFEPGTDSSPDVHPVRITGTAPWGTHGFRIELGPKAELGRVECDYLPRQ
jgi:hypothetical protein